MTLVSCRCATEGCYESGEEKFVESFINENINYKISQQ